MFNQFRVHYPKGSLVTELSAIDHGKYIVRCLVQVEGTTLVTSLAAAETVELAEDKARSRAIEILGISYTTTTQTEKLPVAPPVPALQESAKVRTEVSVTLPPSLSVSTEVSEVSEVTIPKKSEVSEEVSEVSEVTIPKKSEVSEVTIPEKSEVAEVAIPKKIPNSAVTQPSTISETTETSDSVVWQADELKNEAASNFMPTNPVISDSVKQTTVSDTFSAASYLPEASEVKSSVEVSSPLLTTENSSTIGLDNAPVHSSSLSQSQADTNNISAVDTTVDFHEIIAQSNVELKRLGWTNHQGRDYLVQTYGKRSRLELTNAELLDFLHYLEKLPSPD